MQVSSCLLRVAGRGCGSSLNLTIAHVVRGKIINVYIQVFVCSFPCYFIDTATDKKGLEEFCALILCEHTYIPAKATLYCSSCSVAVLPHFAISTRAIES